MAASPDSDTRLDAELANDFVQAIVNIETTLGANPQGVFGSLAARLNQFIPGGAGSPSTFAFNNTTSVSVSGTQSNLGAPAVLYQVYDAAVPAAALEPGGVGVAINQSTYTITVGFLTLQSGLLVVNAGAPQYVTTLTNQLAITIPGSTHQLGTRGVFYQLYTSTDPAIAIQPESMTVHPTSFDVTMTFGQPQSATLLLAAPGPQVFVPFTNQTTLSVPGTTHQLGTQALLFQCYNAATPAAAFQPASVTVHPTTFDVQVTFGQPQSGVLVLSASLALTGTEFEIRDAGIVGRTAVRIHSHTGALLMNGGSQDLIAFQNRTQQTNTMILNTATLSVGIGIFPAFQLHLLTNSAAKPGDPLWTVASDGRLKTVLRPYLDGLALILQLEPVIYHYNGRGGMPMDRKEYVGLVAQDLQPLAHYMVGSYRGRLDPDGEDTEILTFEGGAMTFALINAVKEQQEEVQALQASLDHVFARLASLDHVFDRLAALEQRYTALEARLAALEGVST